MKRKELSKESRTRERPNIEARSAPDVRPRELSNNWMKHLALATVGEYWHHSANCLDGHWYYCLNMKNAVAVPVFP